MKLSPTTTLAALVLIGAGGFMAGRISSPASPSETKSESAETKSLRSKSSLASSGDSPGSKKTSRSAKSEKSNRNGMATATDRLAKLESIVRGENSLERNRALLDYLDQLGPGEFGEAIAHFRSLGITEARMGEYSLMLTAWAEKDPTEALAFAKGATTFSFAQDTILTTWATTDPEAAIQWAKSNYQGDEANPYMAGIIRGLSQSDPARATELLTGMPRSNERGKGLEFMLPHFLEQGAEATQNWIASLGDESLKNGAMMRVADRLAAKDPAGTALWLQANPGEASQRQMDDVYGTWARTDSQAALGSVTSLPAGEARSNALRGVVTAMANENAKEALAVMNRYPNDVTDRTVRDFVWNSFGNDPSTAAAQISRIGNEQERDQMYRRMLDTWIDRDATAASNWMQSNAIPQGIRDRAVRRLSERQQ